MRKKKLTLLVNEDVINKAKKLGLNLSSITESALRITSMEKDSDDIVEANKLLKGYQEIFKSISPILHKWGIGITIGGYTDFIKIGKKEEIDHFTYRLTSDGIYLSDELIYTEKPAGKWKLDDKKLPISHFHDPEFIIMNLIDELYEAGKRNKKKLEKLELVKNILKLSGLTES